MVNTAATVLGEVTAESIKQLKIWFACRFGKTLQLDGLWNEKSLPGWIYEFSTEHYPERDRACDLAKQALLELLENGVEINSVPPWLLIVSESIDDIFLENLESRKLRVIMDIRSLRSLDGGSKRSLFLYIMATVLEAVIQQNNLQSALQGVTEVISVKKTIPDTSRRAGVSWLGLSDPCDYLASLIDLIEKLRDGLTEFEHKFIGFRLVHPYILLGLLPNQTRIPVIAYCGGWKSKPFDVKCGNAPLVLGVHPHCKECERLVCDECGFCYRDCKLNSERQQKVANACEDDIDENYGDVCRLSQANENARQDCPVENLSDEYWAQLLLEELKFGSS